ncbi:MAG TPA: HEAT repeat domain-containing protein, partial [Polyangiaceae bacterium]|nr:HEAT repeat domain-containing protein [Polyangiaceae bacterium]
ATALAARIAEQHVAAFVGWTEHPAPEVRAFAVAFLAQQAADIAVKATVAAVKDADVNVRNVALASLTPRHAAAAPELIRLSESEDWSVRLAAVRAQGAILEATGPAAVIASLSQRATADRTAIVREAALAALAKGAKPAARPVLERARDSDPEPHVRAAAGAWLSSFSAP